MKIETFITTRIGTNTYLLFKDKLAIIIDPGCNTTIVENFLEHNNIKPLAILLTHGHFDHFGGAKYFSNLYNIKIYINVLDRELLEDDLKNGSRLYNHQPLILKDNLKTFKSKKSLKIGDFLFTIISLPGHTKGGVGYLIDNYLFSGDTLFKGTYGRYDFYGGSREKLNESINKLKKLNKKIKVFPGHGELTSIEMEENLEVY